MSPVSSIALLLLSALVTLTLAAGPDCPAIGDANRDTTNYELTVSPSDLSNGTVYTVTFTPKIPVDGSVLLEVVSDNTNNGNWTSLPEGFQNCTGAIYGNYTSSNGSPITAKWTSSTALTSTFVQFRASLNDPFGKFKVDKSVSVAATTTANPISSTSTDTTPTDTSTSTIDNITTASMDPSTTDNITTASIDPSTTDNITTASMDPSTTNNITTASMDPSTTDNITTASMDPSTTDNVTAGSVAPSTTDTVTTASVAPSSTSKMTTVSMSPSSIINVITTSMAPSTNNNAATVSVTPGTTTSHGSTNGGQATQVPMLFTLMGTFFFLVATGKFL